MKCLEFKRLALSDPNSVEVSFVLHSEQCAECLEYVAEVKQMDSDLKQSLDVELPRQLAAKIELQHEMELEGHVDESETLVQLSNNPRSSRFYAIAASVVVGLFVASFLLVNQFRVETQVGIDHETLLAGVVEHLNHQPVVPVWSEDQANRSTRAVLAAYDDTVKLNHLPNLKFGRICPMGKYKGLHASLETSDGLVTFAYIKGEAIGDMIDSSYGGYMTRVKPVQGGNLLILSKSQRSLDEAEQDLATGIVWKI